MKIFPGFPHLGTLQMSIINDSHDRSKRHGAFVKCLDEVCEHHDCENALVDESFEALVCLFIYLDDGLAGILGDFLIDELIVHVAFLEILIFNYRRSILDVNLLIFVHGSGSRSMEVKSHSEED
jgi:hypothetical protein